MRYRNTTGVTYKSRSTIEKAAYLAFLFIGLYSLLGNGSNSFIVIFVPLISCKIDAYFIVAVARSSAFVYHEGPKNIRFVVSFFLKFNQFVVDSFDIFLNLGYFLMDKLYLLLEILDGEIDMLFIQVILDLYDRIRRHVGL